MRSKTRDRRHLVFRSWWSCIFIMFLALILGMAAKGLFDRLEPNEVFLKGGCQ